MQEAGVDLSVIENAEAVTSVIPKFFAFVGDDVLISTDALGNQFKLLSRAARYAGMSEIKNAICDLLDVAADVSPDLDGVNNTREHLLAHFAIAEGKNALEKAKDYQDSMSMSKKAIYDQLTSEYGEQFTAEEAQYAVDNLE